MQKYIKILFLFFLIFFLNSCQNKKALPRYIDESILQEGDIIFRRGGSLESTAVIIADQRGEYSHVGIIVKDSLGWNVVHAVPGENEDKNEPDFIKKEKIELFFRSDRAYNGLILRYNNDTLAKIAAQKALEVFDRKIVFDNDYDEKDTTKMFCTELVEYCYKSAGVDLSEGRKSRILLFGVNQIISLPSSIALNKKLQQVYKY